MVKPNHKAILLQLCASLTLADNLIDVGDDVVFALSSIGIEIEEMDDWQEDVATKLAKMGVKTLYGTNLELDEAEEEE